MWQGAGKTAGRERVAVGSARVAASVRPQGAARERVKHLLHLCGTDGKGRM